MSFGSPTALFWFALAVPLIGFYILKVRLRRVPVSTNLFWKQIYEEKPPRSIWQYLRHLLSLLLQLLMLALLAFAVADPHLPWQLTQVRRVVLVIDRSASMRSTDVEPTRFAAAIEAADAYVDGLRSRDEMAIVVAGRNPEVAVGMSSHVPTLRRKLTALEPSDEPTHLQSAIDLARRLIGDHSNGEVILLTDGCADEFETQATPLSESNPTTSARVDVEDEPAITYRVFATEAANVGLTQFQVRRSLIDPLGYGILAEVKNASPRPVTCRLEIELDGLPVDILPLELEPEETWVRSIEKTSLEGGRVSGRLSEIAAASPSGNEPGSAEVSWLPNQLPTDDIAWAVLPSRQVQPVLIVTPGNLFLQKVFEANPLVAAEVTDELPEQWPDGTLVVLHQMVPETIPPGDVFVVDPSASSDLWTLGDVLANPIITEQDAESPLMTHVRLDNVLMPQARQLEPTQPVHVLAGSVSGDPIYAELLRDAGKCLVLTVDLEESDLAFRTAFPIMVSNALGWFAGTSGELNPAVPTGQLARVPLALPEGSAALLVHPDGEQQPLSIPESAADSAAADGVNPRGQRSTRVSVGPLSRVGVYEIIEGSSATVSSAERPALAAVAVNLASPRETDLRPVEPVPEATARTSAMNAWFSRPVWFYLAILALLLSVGEWGLYHRRIIE